MHSLSRFLVDCVWNVMAHAQKPDFVFRRNERVHLNRRGRQFSRILATEVCASAVVMLDTPCSEIVWRVLATHSIRHVPLHFPSSASPCAITFQLYPTRSWRVLSLRVKITFSYEVWLRMHWVNSRGQPTMGGPRTSGSSEGLTTPYRKNKHVMKCKSGPFLGGGGGRGNVLRNEYIWNH